MFTNDQKVKILQQRLTVDKRDRWPSTWDSVKEALGIDPGIDHTTLVRAARDAIDLGLVEINRTGIARRFTCVVDLQERIKAKFNKLGNVVVVAPILDKQSDSAAGSDEIHELLGRAAAKALDDSFFFEQGQRIGTGGGRAVYRFAHAFAELNKENRKKDMRVVLSALTGSLLASDHASATRVMDADANILLLRTAFKEAQCRYVNYPLMPANLRLLVEARKYTPLDRAQGNLESAVVGAGVLSNGHKLYEWANLQPDWVDKTLKPVHSWVRELKSLCDKFATGDYVPVGDVCNHLMFFAPPKDIRVPDNTAARMQRLIAAINKRLLTISWPALTSIKKLALIAGGPGKAWAISSLVGHPDLPIKFLCTDETTARKICGSD